MHNTFAFTTFNGDIGQWDVGNVKNMRTMFYSSEFHRDLSDWKPYKLETSEDMFLDCLAPIPYWKHFGNNASIVKSINSFVLNNKLNRELRMNTNIKKKNKI